MSSALRERLFPASSTTPSTPSRTALAVFAQRIDDSILPKHRFMCRNDAVAEVRLRQCHFPEELTQATSSSYTTYRLEHWIAFCGISGRLSFIPRRCQHVEPLFPCWFLRQLLRGVRIVRSYLSTQSCGLFFPSLECVSALFCLSPLFLGPFALLATHAARHAEIMLA